MKKYLSLVLLFALFLTSYSQTTETDIINALMGSDVKALNETLASIPAWYHVNEMNSRECFVSVENGLKSTKLFIITFNERGTIQKIVINYRHDNKNHLIELDSIKGAGDINIGKFSTDVIITERKWNKYMID